MTLNIKDPEAHKLAKAIQRETGETLTQAVRQSLRERLERVRRRRNVDAKVKELLAIGRRFARQIKGPLIDHDEFLYDENGLPK